MNQEEMYWFQKSRSEWLSNGDRNTTFFRSRMIKRRRQNKISSLRIDGPDWCFENDKLRAHAVGYFSPLYTVEDCSFRAFPVHGRFPKLGDSILSELMADITFEEVRCLVCSIL